jgi:hypothetical protein
MPQTSAPVSAEGWEMPGLPSAAGILELIPGGVVLPFLAGSNLNVGDAVYISADKTVDKSIVLANHSKRAGIVVGGDRLAPTGPGGTVTKQGIGEVIWDITQYGVARVAANAGEMVWVMFSGVSYVVTDGAIAAGAAIKQSIITAGQVGPAAALSVAAGAVAVTSTAANGAADIAGDSQTRVIGHMLEASSGAGQVRLAFISPM